ncbi:glycosyltransferase family 9 protein, partial [bacterium]
MKVAEIKYDCRFLRGDVPCKPNKEHGAVCNSCIYYKKFDSRILIIKLGAAGDVIRTTPLLHPLRKQYPDAKISWLTYTAEFVPLNSEVSADEALLFNLQNITYLQSVNFDLVINLDKDREAIGLVNALNAKTMLGFGNKNGVCYPLNDFANQKYLTGLFDSVSKDNRKSYLQEIFEICGYSFNGEKYIIEKTGQPKANWNISASK